MATSLLLFCAAATRMARIGGFPAADEPLDEGGRRDAARCRLPGRYHATVLVSPMRAAVETAAAMGLSPRPEAALSDGDHGLWAGRSLAEIAPDALADWLADPTQGTPGGEGMMVIRQRAGCWLDGIAVGGGAVAAVTHATLIRAALSHALDMPLTATVRIDIAPLSHMLLSFNGVWRLQALGPSA